jgi:hypothetical protein
MPEYFLITALKNVYAKATNKEILKNTLQSNPYILQNYAIPQSYLYLNFINDLASNIVNTQDSYNDTFDILG